MKKRSTIRVSGLILLTFFLFFTFPQVREMVQGSFPEQKDEDKKEEKQEAGAKEKKQENETYVYLQKQPEAVLPDVPPKPFRILIPDPAWLEYFAFPYFRESEPPVQASSLQKVCTLFFTSIQRNAP